VALVKYCQASATRLSEASERRYLKQAFGHPLNVSVIVVLAVFALAYGAFPWLVLGVALELMALSALLHTDFFRARAKRQLRESELANLRMQLEGSQLRELQRLEELAQAVQRAAGRPDSASPPALADGEVLRRLLERFLRLSLSQKAGRELIARTDRHALDEEIRKLSASRELAPPAVRRLQESRLELARRRVQRLVMVEERVELVTQQLAAIGEMIHFLHEQALAPADAQALAETEDLEHLMGDLDDHELALNELEQMAQPSEFLRSPA
jgi:hypothetical protein